MKPNDIFVTTQNTEPFQDANQVDVTDSNQDLLSQVSPMTLQEFSQDLSSIADDISIPVMTGTTIPSSMTHPVPIPIAPYHYDPTDNDQVTYGFVVDQLLSVPAISSSTTDEFLSFFTYLELTGYDEYDGFYGGYPASENHLMAPSVDFSALFSIQDTPAHATFDSRVYAVAS